jgi:hypothetical protein
MPFDLDVRDADFRARVRATGLLHHQSFDDSKSAVRAAIAWAVAAHEDERGIANLVALLVKPDGLEQMNASLVTRQLIKGFPTLVVPELREVLAERPADESLLFLVVDGEETSSFTLSLAELKEANFGG